jgi:hypothetical protein
MDLYIFFECPFSFSFQIIIIKPDILINLSCQE